MLAIKLRRVGKKHQASFRVVVAEKRSKLGGKFVDDLGWMDPHQDTFELNKERVEHWLKSGAQPTESVHNLLVKAGIVKGPKVAVHGVKKEKKEGEAEGGEKKEGGEASVEEKAPEAAAEPEEKKEEPAEQKEEKETESKEKEKVGEDADNEKKES